MFQVGETIVCDHNGVCRILDICEMPALKAGVLYYQLEPVYAPGTRIFAPVDSGKLVMRQLVSKEEAGKLIDEIPSIPAIGITNEKKREDEYKEAARKYEPREWVRIIKTICQRKQSRRMEGKKATYIDDKYMKMAEDNLYKELGITFGTTPEGAKEYITVRMKDK